VPHLLEEVEVLPWGHLLVIFIAEKGTGPISRATRIMTRQEGGQTTTKINHAGTTTTKMRKIGQGTRIRIEGTEGTDLGLGE